MPLPICEIDYVRLVAIVCAALGLACGVAPPTKPPSAPPAPVIVAPARAPSATTLVNVTALRNGKRTPRMVPVMGTFLPKGESIDDVEWFALDGPSLLDTSPRNVVFIGRSARELQTIRGAESGDRVAVTPKPPLANELLRIHVGSPKKILHVPYLEPPDTVEELTYVAEAREDGGADLRLRERCTSPAEAKAAAAVLDAMVDRLNERGVGIVTGGLFADVKATVDGSDARLDIVASPDQVEALVDLAVMLSSRSP